MKLITFLVLLSACFFMAYSVKVTTWGRATKRIAGEKRIILQPSTFQKKYYTFGSPFNPMVPSKDPILGIRHVDFERNPVTVKFLGGKIGDKSITLRIESQRNFGVNSTFTFYTV